MGELSEVYGVTPPISSLIFHLSSLFSLFSLLIFDLSERNENEKNDSCYNRGSVRIDICPGKKLGDMEHLDIEVML